MLNVEVLEELLRSDESSPRCDRAEARPVAHQAVRLERICHIRRLIDSGRYENKARLQIALDRLLDDMM